jgi:coenzyme F420-reducing hydrogenase beta subunit
MKKTLEQGGVVIGAAFDESMTLRHQIAQNALEGEKFRGSKYLQSVIGDTYREAKSYLQQGRRVLFSGTPCQIAGLYSYLGQDKDNVNLLTCDLVCHGVPSPKVFAAYKASLEHLYDAKVSRIAFRRKDCGWKRYSVALSFDNATEYRRLLTDDPFMIGFLRDTYLRPSCHVCKFSRLPRVADLTLGDFWGVDRHHPEWDDDQGTSLVLVETVKGQEAFDGCCDELVTHKADLTLAIQSNPCICGSVKPGRHRTAFFKDLDRQPFEYILKKYMSPPSPLRKTVRFARRIASHCAYWIRSLQR